MQKDVRAGKNSIDGSTEINEETKPSDGEVKVYESSRDLYTS